MIFVQIVLAQRCVWWMSVHPWCAALTPVCLGACSCCPRWTSTRGPRNTWSVKPHYLHHYPCFFLLNIWNDDIKTNMKAKFTEKNISIFLYLEPPTSPHTCTASVYYLRSASCRTLKRDQTPIQLILFDCGNHSMGGSELLGGGLSSPVPSSKKHPKNLIDLTPFSSFSSSSLILSLLIETM